MVFAGILFALRSTFNLDALKWQVYFTSISIEIASPPDSKLPRKE